MLEVCQMKLLLYANLNRLGLEKIDEFHNKFPEVYFIIDRQQLDREIENRKAIVSSLSISLAQGS